MNFRYGLNDRPPWSKQIVMTMQWLAVAVPAILIIGNVVAGMEAGSALGQVTYLQKLFLVTGLVLLVQVAAGHRMPLVVGPATVLLIALVASQSSSAQAISTSMLISGFLLTLLSVTGLFAHIKQLFTPRVVAVVLILIALTLSPTILNLLVDPSGRVPAYLNLLFSLILILLTFAAHRRLTGIWKATLVVWMVILGSVTYALLWPLNPAETPPTASVSLQFLTGFTLGFELDPGVLAAFLFSFLALSINDLGSIQSVGSMLHLEDMEQRVTRGISVTGLGNMLAGIYGIIGPVNFSLSPGVIAATGSASRYPLLPAAGVLILLACSPMALAFMATIPAPVVGTILIYIMCSQIAAGLLVMLESSSVGSFEDGLIVGLPLMLGTVIAFLPPEAAATIPTVLRPLVGNGFVVGVAAVLILEHWFWRSGPIKREAP